MRERGFWKRDTRCGQSTSTSFISTGTVFPPIGAGRCGMPTRWDCKRSTSEFANSTNSTENCGRRLLFCSAWRKSARLLPSSTKSRLRPRKAEPAGDNAGERELTVRMTKTLGDLMREAVIVASSRTALAKSFRGSFNLTRPDELAAHCIQDVLRKTPQLDPREVEDVILGCGQPHGPQGHNIARVSAMLAGLPTSTGGVTVNRFCSSGLQSIALAAYQIMCG